MQWKQNFKDKLQQEKLELQRDAERANASRIQDRSIMQERMSLRILTLYGRQRLAVAFQKLREHRKQVLWLQRVKELKTQCESLREEAAIAASNAMSASHEFTQQEFVQRIMNSLSHLLAIAQGHDLEMEGGWMLSDIVAVGNAVVAEKIRQLLTVIQQLKTSESALQRRTADLMQGSPMVAQLQERVQVLERELHGKRKAVESLSMQLDIERDAQRDSRRSSPRASAVLQSPGPGNLDMIQRELSLLTEAKMKLEEEMISMKSKVIRTSLKLYLM